MAKSDVSKKKKTVKVAEPVKTAVVAEAKSKKKINEQPPVSVETDSTTDNEKPIISKKAKKAPIDKKNKKQEPISEKKKDSATVMEDDSSSSSSSDESDKGKKRKISKALDASKKPAPKKQTKKVASSSSSEESSDDSSSEDDSSDNDTSKKVPETIASDDSSSTDSSSDSESSQKIIAKEDSKKNSKELIKPVSDDEESSDDSSSEKDDETTSDDSSDEDEDSKKGGLLEKQVESDATSEASEAVDESQDNAQTSQANSTYDSSVFKVWKCQINEETQNPEWILDFDRQETYTLSQIKYRTDIVDDMPMLLIVKKDQFNDTSLQMNKKRARISLDNSNDSAQPPKKQFQLDADGKQEIFVGNLPYGTSEQELRSLFEDSCGRIVRMKLLGQGGAAFLEFENAKAVQSALEWNRSDYNGRKLTINLASEKPDKSAAPANGFNKQRQDSSPPNSTVIVRNIPFSTNVDELKTYFSQCGNVTHVNLPIYPDTNKIKGFGVVHFTNSDDANAALELSGTQISGRTISVEIAHARDNSRGPPQQRGPPQRGFQQQRGGGQKRSFQGGKPRFEKNNNSHQIFNDDD